MATPDKFYQDYPAFTGYAYEFSDPSDDDASDETMARNVIRRLPGDERARAAPKLISEAERMLRSLSEDWRSLSSYVNRGFKDEVSARRWLESVLQCWREERDSAA